jgi:hypothetical protein
VPLRLQAKSENVMNSETNSGIYCNLLMDNYTYLCAFTYYEHSAFAIRLAIGDAVRPYRNAMRFDALEWATLESLTPVGHFCAMQAARHGIVVESGSQGERRICELCSC